MSAANNIPPSTVNNMSDMYNVYANGGTSAAQSTGGVAMNVAQTAYDVSNILQSDAAVEDKAEAAKKRIALAVADYYTCGLASNFAAFAHKQWPGTMAKVSEYSAKLDPMIQMIGEFFGSKNMWKTEGDRQRKLLEAGIEIPEELRGAMNLTKGRSKEELVDQTVAPDFRGYKEDGQYVNNLFANSRDVKDMVAEDIWAYSGFFEKFGNDWLQKFTPAQRFEISNKALELGAVSEHHGTVDIKWDTPGFDQAVQEIIANPSKYTQDKTDFSKLGTASAPVNLPVELDKGPLIFNTRQEDIVAY